MELRKIIEKRIEEEKKKLQAMSPEERTQYKKDQEQKELEEERKLNDEMALRYIEQRIIIR